MLNVIKTKAYADWFDRLRDERAKARINLRILRLASGHAGDAKALGSGLHEIRVDYGPGYRIYFVRRGSDIIVLLCGGDKDSQHRDIETARRLARDG